MTETLLGAAKARLAQGDSAYQIDNKTAASLAKRLNYNTVVLEHEPKGRSRNRVETRAQTLVKTDGVSVKKARQIAVKEERKTKAVKQRIRLATIETTKQAVAKHKPIDEGLVKLFEDKV